MKRKSDLSRYTRHARKMRERRRRKIMWTEQVGEERLATSFEMETNWKEFSIGFGQYRNRNVYIPQQLCIGAGIKEEVQENLLGTENVRVKLEFETDEDMEQRMLNEINFVDIENVNTVKVEPIAKEE